ncbi:hypothetical protein GALL_465010 [mine drainage metagenome]|uniref:Uncharacterized protein n=1 Tax=mine drainage metagenome TaxID=410659 RepID=A0A1J5PL52_9ZZZZ
MPGGNGLAAKLDGATLQDIKPKDGAGEGGFSRAGFANKAKAFALVQREADGVDGAVMAGGREGRRARQLIVAGGVFNV